MLPERTNLIGQLNELKLELRATIDETQAILNNATMIVQKWQPRLESELKRNDHIHGMTIREIYRDFADYNVPERFGKEYLDDHIRGIREGVVP